VIVKAGASLAATIFNCSVGLQASINFQASAAASSAATINALNLDGTLIVSGTGSVTFPTASTSCNTGTSATVKAAGGVIITGALNSASLTIGGVTKAKASVEVKASGTLSTTGNILAGVATAGSATLTVHGGFNWGGSSCTNTNIEVQGSSSSSGYTGQLAVQATTMTHTGGTVSVTGAGVVRISNPGTGITFATFSACSTDSFIDILTTASVIASGSASGVAFKFDAATTTEANMLCDIRLVDPTGVQASVVLTNTNRVAAGRRLLASTGTSTWNNNGEVTYTYGSGNGASTTSASGVVVLVSAIAAFIVARFA
jgi:hypothetical protein